MFSGKPFIHLQLAHTNKIWHTYSKVCRVQISNKSLTQIIKKLFWAESPLSTPEITRWHGMWKNFVLVLTQFIISLSSCGRQSGKLFMLWGIATQKGQCLLYIFGSFFSGVYPAFERSIQDGLHQRNCESNARPFISSLPAQYFQKEASEFSISALCKSCYQRTEVL